MEMVFIDETSDTKFKNYFGLCLATINSFHYKTLKDGFHSILRESGWNENIEFKGAYLFSSSCGDPQIGIDKRIDICSNLLDLNSSNTNARMKFYYASDQDCSNQKNAYLFLCQKLLKKALVKVQKGRGKDIVSINCDNRNDIDYREINNVISPILKEKEYTLYEEVVMRNSAFETIGILYADIIGYLAAKIETIANDSELFESIPPEQFENNGKIKKLKSSTALIEKIKKLELYEVKK